MKALGATDRCWSVREDKSGLIVQRRMSRELAAIVRRATMRRRRRSCSIVPDETP